MALQSILRASQPKGIFNVMLSLILLEKQVLQVPH